RAEEPVSARRRDGVVEGPVGAHVLLILAGTGPLWRVPHRPDVVLKKPDEVIIGVLARFSRTVRLDQQSHLHELTELVGREQGRDHEPAQGYAYDKARLLSADHRLADGCLGDLPSARQRVDL